MKEEKKLLEEIYEIMENEYCCNSCKIQDIKNLIDEYEYKNDEEEDYSSPTCIIKNIYGKSTNDLTAIEIYYLLDALIEILIKSNLLDDDSRLVDKGDIDISDCSTSDLSMMLDDIIDKITDIMDNAGLLV